jgi:hypothetical protein
VSELYILNYPDGFDSRVFYKDTGQFYQLVGSTAGGGYDYKRSIAANSNLCRLPDGGGICQG